MPRWVCCWFSDILWFKYWSYSGPNSNKSTQNPTRKTLFQKHHATYLAIQMFVYSVDETQRGCSIFELFENFHEAQPPPKQVSTHVRTMSNILCSLSGFSFDSVYSLFNFLLVGWLLDMIEWISFSCFFATTSAPNHWMKKIQVPLPWSVFKIF